MKDRDIAEQILKSLLNGKKIKTTDIDKECKLHNVNNFTVYEFLKEHTRKEQGFNDYNFIVIKEGSANFVYLDCWSGEEKRREDERKSELEENKKNRRNIILSAVITGIITFIAGYILAKINC